mmetsp:Transcript_20742/g.50983  ORF Transcript_20742/g.50983 Transcript_20742/m.50983 type:complete len:405 (-) Transcript_20742:1318-2532(-)
MAWEARALGVLLGFLLVLQPSLPASPAGIAGPRPMSLGELLAESGGGAAAQAGGLPRNPRHGTPQPPASMAWPPHRGPAPGAPPGKGSPGHEAAGGGSVEDLCLRGQQMLARGDGAAALAAYERAVDLRPDHGHAMMMLGRLVELVRGNTTQASALYMRALEASPDSAACISNYAYMLETKYGDSAGAERMYRKALGVDPTSVATYNNLAHIIEGRDAENERAVPEAEALYKRALEVSPSSVLTLSNYAGMLHDRTSDGVGAARLYARALEIEPQNVEVLLNYAIVVEEWSEDQTLAKTLYNKALAIDPAHGLAMLRFGRRLRIDKEFKEAEKVLSAAKKLYPHSEEILYEAYALREEASQAAAEESAKVAEAGGRMHPKVEHDESFYDVDNRYEPADNLDTID